MIDCHCWKAECPMSAHASCERLLETQLASLATKYLKRGHPRFSVATQTPVLQFVAARSVRPAPMLGPYHTRSPFTVLGPSQNALATLAALSLIVISPPVCEQLLIVVPTSSWGLKLSRQASGSEISPSTTPSRPSQTSTAAAAMASSSHP